MEVIYLSENNNSTTENSPASGEEKSIAETAKINEYSQNAVIKDHVTNLIAFIASTIRILLNKPKQLSRYERYHRNATRILGNIRFG